MVVHALGETLIALLGHRLRGHRDDRQAVVARIRPDLPGGLVAVHHRHLHVDQHDVVGRRLYWTGDRGHRLAAVIGDGHRRTRARQQFDRDLLIDYIVLDQ